MTAPSRVLVIEDNPVTRKLIAGTLRAAGHEVDEAPDGKTAVERAESARFDLIVQDLLLPDMDGFELAGRLRNARHGAETPILACTGFLSRADEARLVAARFDDWLLKPIEPLRLVQAVRSYLSPRLGGTAARTVKPVTILLIDDDPVQLKLQRVILTNLGYQVVSAPSGALGLDLSRARRPDLIVCDILMPGMDGFQFTATVRKDPGLAGVPVLLATSSYVSPEDRALALKMGAQDVVFRTSAMENVTRAIAELLEKPSFVAPPANASDPADVREEYVGRVMAQLERQAAANASLGQRAALQASALSILGGISEIVGQRVNPEGALPELLAQCIDAAGISRGAVYLRSEGGWHCAAQLGYAGVAQADLDTFFGEIALLEAITAGGSAVRAIDGHDDEAGGRFLERAEGSSALVAPLASQGSVVGALLLVSTGRQLQQDEWKGFAQTVASQLAQAIALGRAFSEMADAAERYRMLFENNPHPMWVVDAESLRFLAVNEAMVRQYGYSRNALLQMTAADIRPPEEVPAFLSFIASMANRANLGTVVRHRRRDGSVMDVEVSAQRLVFDGRPALMGLGLDITERSRAEAALRESEERFRQLAEHIREAFFLTDAESMQTLYISPMWSEIWGRPTEEVYRNPAVWLESIHPEDRASMAAALEAGRAGKETTEVFRVLRPDDTQRWVRARAFPIRNERGAVYRLVGVIEDITELRQVEEQAAQAQRMEAVGRLAGGVAHDFNNLLTVIMGEVELTLMDDVPASMRASLAEVRRAAERASVLTSQLLAFSRRQLIEPVVFDINGVIGDMVKMMGRLIGEDIELVTRASSGPARVRADRGQVEQVLANLVVNSRDAMPRGGRITIEVTHRALSDHDVETLGDVRPGRYVVVAVTDTGTGMTKDVQARIFEPFFTTKERGKGTGLGLATSFGIVKQGGGHLSVYSEPGLGTTIRVYLPQVDDEAQAAAPGEASSVPRGTETLLLVEDEIAVRRVAARTLRSLGYTVLEAGNAHEALDILRSRGDTVQLLLTDVVLPGPGGRELAEMVKRERPSIRVLFVSGYTDDIILQHQLLEKGITLLQKPFTRETLARKVREVLAG